MEHYVVKLNKKNATSYVRDWDQATSLKEYLARKHPGVIVIISLNQLIIEAYEYSTQSWLEYCKEKKVEKPW